MAAFDVGERRGPPDSTQFISQFSDGRSFLKITSITWRDPFAESAL
jgi:hypothetical protein